MSILMGTIILRHLVKFSIKDSDAKVRKTQIHAIDSEFSSRPQTKTAATIKGEIK